MIDEDEAVDETPLVITTTDLITPTDRDYWLYDDMFDTDDTGMIKPRFTIKETAQCFFGRDADWLRWRMRPDKLNKDNEHRYPHGFFVLDGEPMVFKRMPPKTSDPEETTARYFTLADIERMAHALGQQKVIDGVRVGHIVVMTRVCAKLYGVAT